MEESKFDETILLRGLIERPSEALRFSRTFKPEWLNEAKYVPILLEVYAFTRKEGMTPSCDTLHRVFKDKDPDYYKVMKPYIDKIKNTEPDASFIQYTLAQANDVALTRSLSILTANPAFQTKIQDQKGAELVREINNWMNMFKGRGEDKAMSLKEAIEFRMKLDMDDNTRIPCGIRPIDNWCNGGLFKKNLGIVMAGTGVGKSVALQGIAHTAALVEGKKVLFISNELSIEEMANRFMSKLAGIKLDDVENKPGKAYAFCRRYWENHQLDEKWKMMYYNRTVSTDEFEAELDRLRTTENWEPDVLVVDYMGRMTPKDKGYTNRENTWNWMGAVAGDLVRLAKDYNVLVWTGAQTNRKAQGGEKVTIEASQGSIQHLQEAACVVGLSRAQSIELEGKEITVLRLDALKMRQGRISAEPAFVKAELSKMHITNEIIVDYQDICEEQHGEQMDDPDTPLDKQKKRAKAKSAWDKKNDGA